MCDSGTGTDGYAPTVTSSFTNSHHLFATNFLPLLYSFPSACSADDGIAFVIFLGLVLDHCPLFPPPVAYNFSSSPEPPVSFLSQVTSALPSLRRHCRHRHQQQHPTTLFVVCSIIFTEILLQSTNLQRNPIHFPLYHHLHSLPLFLSKASDALSLIRSKMSQSDASVSGTRDIEAPLVSASPPPLARSASDPLLHESEIRSMRDKPSHFHSKGRSSPFPLPIGSILLLNTLKSPSHPPPPPPPPPFQPELPSPPNPKT